MKEMSLEEIKLTTIGVLNFVDKVCLENELRYFLCGGTLLGAVRHNGFIPWDDDIDIMMPRRDYDRLLEVWPDNSYFAFRNYKNTPNFPYAYGKAFDTRTIKQEPLRKKCQLIGVDVDVFPIDNLPDDHTKALKLFNDVSYYSSRLYKHIYGFHAGIRSLKSNFALLYGRFLELLGAETINSLIVNISECAQRFSEVETDYCGITSISHYGIKEMNPKTNYSTAVNVLFENQYYPAPVGFADYLKRLYGDNYMQLPPVESRQTHHIYKAYWK